MSLNIKKGDTVIVLGTRKKDKNGNVKVKKGKVLSVNPQEESVVVEGVNFVTKHRKPRGREDQGGIIKKEAPIHVSNVMVVCPKCGEPTRTGKKAITEGDKTIKVRVCKKCGADIRTADSTK